MSTFNYLNDPSFETGVGWTGGGSCVANDSTRQNNNARTGAWSWRLRSRNVGPTCGAVSRPVDTPLVVGRQYLGGVWWRSSGVFPGTLTTITIGAQFIGQINSNTTAYRILAAVFTADGTNPIYLIDQGPPVLGTGFQSRFFDDAFVYDLESPDAAALLSLSARGLASVKESPQGNPGASERVIATLSPLSISAVALSLGLRATARKP